MTTVEIPQFDFTGFYYPQILEALIQFKRGNVPELTDESPQEPLIQLLRAFACVGHLNSTLIDLIANENTLPTSKLVETVRNMLRLIDYQLAAATPAQTDLIYELGQVLSATVEVVPLHASAATRAEPDLEARFFEVLEALSVTRTDELTSALAVEDSVYTDVTTEANSTPATSTFTPWATPVGGSSSREGDSMQFAHSEVMFDLADIALDTPGSGLTGVWEYYDGVFEKGAPDTVTDLGSTLRIEIDTILNFFDSRIGTKIRVRLNSTGAFEDVFSDHDGTNFVTTTLLGQSSPSTTASDYTVGSDWEPLFVASGDADGTAGLTVSGEVEYGLPQTLTRNWKLGTFENVEAFWIRYRIISVSTPVSPIVGQVKIDTGKQYVHRLVTQGRRQVDDPLGSSDGTAKQRFEGSREDFINGTEELSVDDIDWTSVENLFVSRPTDRHYVVELGDDDRPTFVFGDGINGAIPAVGVGNIRGEYRYSAAVDGNVGAETIVSDKSGLTFVSRLFNPRPATGWQAAAGSTEASLELAKIEGPASLRVLEVALGPDDVETLVKRASEIDTALIAVARAKAIEEGFGPKTIEAVIVAAGAALASQDSLDALTEFFNGDQFSVPVKRKRLVANQEATAVNYTPRVVDVTAVVTDSGDVTVAQIEAQLSRLLQPEALQNDGVTWIWDFGGKVPVSRLEHEIFNVATTITDVDVSAPASDIQLTTRELPTVGTLSITMA